MSRIFLDDGVADDAGVSNILLKLAGLGPIPHIYIIFREKPPKTA